MLSPAEIKGDAEYDRKPCNFFVIENIWQREEDKVRLEEAMVVVRQKNLNNFLKSISWDLIVFTHMYTKI